MQARESFQKKCSCQHQETSKCCDSELHGKHHIQSTASLKTDFITMALGSAGENPQSMCKPDDQSVLMAQKKKKRKGIEVQGKPDRMSSVLLLEPLVRTRC